MKPITPMLWYAEKAEEAARFYVSVFPDSKIGRVMKSPAVTVVDFTLNGKPFVAMAAGQRDAFNHAISFVVNCEIQSEIDRYWNALLEGGSPEQCGWLKDRYGVSWQIVPTVLSEMMSDPDREKSMRAMQAMMKMVKLDIAGLQQAFEGR